MIFMVLKTGAKILQKIHLLKLREKKDRSKKNYSFLRNLFLLTASIVCNDFIKVLAEFKLSCYIEKISMGKIAVKKI